MTDDDFQQIAVNISALKILVASLLSDKFGDNLSPKRASEKFLANVFSATNRDSSISQETLIRLSEEIAAIVHAATQIAVARGLEDKEED